ncbi:MAG: hypothetical protein V1695_02180 [Candidatus Uhrbacteria bacterium]
MQRFVLTIMMFGLLLCPTISFAQIDPSETGLDETAIEAGFVAEEGSAPELTTFIGTIINVVLGLSGVALVVLFVYGGILWMTAMGNKDQVDKAKRLLTNTIIGMIIIVAAYAIADYIVASLTLAVQGD